MAGLTIIGLLILWILFPSLTFARRNGADPSACEDMRPRHIGDPQPQMSSVPFTMSLSQTHLALDEKLSITLAVKPGSAKSFKGFLIQVRQVGGAVPALGMFDLTADGDTKVLNCQFGSSVLTNSAITHSRNKKKTAITVTWTPPRQSELMEYTVFYTVVEKEDTFWVKVPHSQTVTVEGSPDAELGSLVSSRILIKLRKVYGRCGTEKYGCFGVPQNCIAKFDINSQTPRICDMMVTWSKEDLVQNDFSIISKPIGLEIGGYVAFGISDDNQMGNDSVVGCIFPEDGSPPQGKRYFNTLNRTNELYMNGRYGVHAYEVAKIDGIVFCGFTQSDHKIYEEVIDFNNKYFLMLARGTTFTDTGLGVHPRMKDRVVTDFAIRLTKDFYVVENGPEPNQLVYLHGTTMLFTWFVVAPTGAFTARYFKLTRVDQILWKRPFWFTTHVIWMVATSTLTFISAILIFAKKGWKFDNRYYHNIMGLVLNVTLMFQLVVALSWPHSNEGYRKVFKWIHFTVSVFLNWTAITCIILVHDIRLAKIEHRHNSHGRLWVIFSITIAVFQVLMHFIMTYHTYWADGEMNVDENLQFRAFTIGPLGSNGLFTEQPGRRFRYLMLVSYIVCSVLTVIVLSFLLYF